MDNIEIRMKVSGVKAGMSGIKVVNINSIKYKKRIKEQVQKLINREINYISGIFPFHNEEFYNRGLVYLQSVMLWKDFVQDDADMRHQPDSDDNLAYLLTGLELLGIGISFHNFDTADIMLSQKGCIPEKIEKKYTLKLLFGDIFYSRAVIYFLQFHDYEIFRNVLSSLKHVHEGRLDIHKKIMGIIKDGNEKTGVHIKKQAIVMANYLLRESFYIGYKIFRVSRTGVKTDGIFRIADLIVALATCTDIENYHTAIKESPLISSCGLTFLRRKINFINRQLDDMIPELDTGCLKESLNAIRESFS
ncbi:MAG: hypothetical protein JW770_04240 [Actinobacteria bacterium]|nr:hypothetical protein [Actinomycetota bacterium]